MSLMTNTAIIALKTIILIFGSGVTVTAFKAYRRTGDPALRALAIGFGTITLGALFAGVAHQLLGVTIKQGVVINSFLVAIGLAIIMYSLYLVR